MKLKAHRLTAQQAVKMSKEFYDAIGKERALVAYGWTHPPERSVVRVYSYTDQDGHVVAWGSVNLNLSDAEDDEARVALGVFPDYQRHGYRMMVYDDLVGKAQKWGASYASAIVFKANEEEYKRRMRETYEKGSRWVHAGDIWYPAPGYGYFVCPLEEKKKEDAK